MGMGMASTVPALATVGKCRETVRTGALLLLAVAVILSTFTVCRRSSRPSNAAQALCLVCPSFDEMIQHNLCCQALQNGIDCEAANVLWLLVTKQVRSV